MQSSKDLLRILKKHSFDFAPVVTHNLNHPALLVFDLTINNTNLQKIDLVDTTSFSRYIFEEMAKSATPVAIGRYNENREIYRRSNHFQGGETRSIHLGIDIWAEAGNDVFSPLAGKVHSFRDNKGFGDYGPTIILEHSLEGLPFYTLYGHLSKISLLNLNKNQEIKKGEKIGTIGPYPENGDWPPHLHFQIIADMQTYDGDFPGVAAPSTMLYFLELCPDPNLILGIEKLNYQ
jgi:murein DD-endopeptidase MepM/ murein hydrolase activator NlpD